MPRSAAACLALRVDLGARSLTGGAGEVVCGDRLRRTSKRVSKPRGQQAERTRAGGAWDFNGGGATWERLPKGIEVIASMPLDVI